MKLRLHLSKPKTYLFVACSLLLLGAVPYFAGPGLTTAEPLGKYLNNNFPAIVSTPQGLPYEPIFPNLTFDSPLTFNELPTGNRVLVGQRDGKIYWFNKTPDVTQKNMLLDLSNKVGVVWDGGFLGLALHPEFGTPGNNYFYTYYTTKDVNGNNFPNSYTTQNCDSEEYWGNFLILSRYTMNPNSMQVSPSSEQVMFKLRMYGTTHRGGGLLFGDDGFLYLTTGDQTAFRKSQDITNNLDGGVLRFDVDKDPQKSHAPVRTMPQDHGFSDEFTGIGYWIPNDNPFLSPGGQNFEEYYSMGHRNPHRMTKDRLTGDLYIGEVGLNRHEEVNVVKKGGNFGWPVYEGNLKRDLCGSTLYNNMPHEGPLVAFPRAEANALMGGYVYRGEEVPELRGRYICADYGNGEELFSVNITDGSYEQIGTFSSTNIISFGEDNQGELYILKQGVSTLYKMVTKMTFNETLPQSLSESGAFTNLTNLTPVDGLIPYDLVESFWSDGALKKRWIGIPNDGTHDTAEEQIDYSENGNWILPVGSVLVKHFEMPLNENNPSITKRLETRFSVKAADGNFYFATYKWNNAQTDAILLTSGLDESLNIIQADGSTRTQTWRYPDRNECVTCHNSSTGGTIGTRTRYLNKDITYPKTGISANQLVTLSHLGILNQSIVDADTPSLLTYKSIDDANATVEEKARSYMDLNCAYCHQAGSDVRADFDLRMSLDLAGTGLLDAVINNSLGVPGEKILAEGEPEKSIVYLRANSANPTISMPPVAKNRVDADGVALIEAWITQLGDTPEVAVYNVLLSPSELTIDVGETFQLTATTEPSNATNQGVSWVSDNPAIATVDASTGLVTGIGSGAVTIAVITDDGGYNASTLVTVDGPAELIPVYNVLVAPSEVTMDVGETFQLTATTEPSNATNQGVSWITDNAQIATVNANTGVVTAISGGEVIIAVITDDGGYFGTALITVNGSTPLIPVYNVILSPSAITMDLGSTFQLAASTEPSNATNQGFDWFSSDSNIVEIDDNGMLTAVGAGTTDVAVRSDDGGYFASAMVTVVGSALSSRVSLYPNPASDVLNVDLSDFMGQEVEIKLYNQSNRLLETYNVAANHPEINPLTLDDYPNGYYYLIFQTDDGLTAKSIIIN